MTLLTLAKSFASDLVSIGPVSATTRAARVCRSLPLSEDMQYLLKSPSALAHRKAVAPHDAFFAISHRHYLCQSLSLEKRVAAARQVYEFLDCEFKPAVASAVSGRGWPLWTAESNGHTFEIRLMLGNHNMYEGALSATFYLDNRHVGVMSFSIVNGSLFGLGDAPVLLLCRNQTTSDRWYQKPLQEAFKHIALPYLMLAAVAGVANALNSQFILAVLEDFHPAVKGGGAEVMRGSYSQFWEKYHAVPFSDGIVKISLPLESTPIEQVASNHRRRARARRELMETVMNAAASSFDSALISQPVHAAQQEEQTQDMQASIARRLAAVAPFTLGIAYALSESVDRLPGLSSPGDLVAAFEKLSGFVTYV